MSLKKKYTHHNCCNVFIFFCESYQCEFLSFSPATHPLSYHCQIRRLEGIHICPGQIQSVLPPQTQIPMTTKQSGRRGGEAKDIKFLLDPPPDSHLTHCLGLIKPTPISFIPIAFLQAGHMES